MICDISPIENRKKSKENLNTGKKISHLPSERLLLMTRQGLLQTQMGHDFNEKFVSYSHWENWANFIPQLQILYYF